MCKSRYMLKMFLSKQETILFTLFLSGAIRVACANRINRAETITGSSSDHIVQEQINFSLMAQPRGQRGSGKLNYSLGAHIITWTGKVIKGITTHMISSRG